MRPATVALESALEKWSDEPIMSWPVMPAQTVAGKNLATWARL